ncbi:MAG: hypothetical protein Q7S13_01555 [Candidatus Omnitrophota bacterium]|nr:hypothetical protein [Candidatus Omnitrophota bacterium]
MIEKLVRVYAKYDVAKIAPHLLIYGDLSGACGHCQATDIKLDTKDCPQCGNAFRYVAFRNVKSHIPKIYKLIEERPEVIIVDFDDFKRETGAAKAQEFFKS